MLLTFAAQGSEPQRALDAMHDMQRVHTAPGQVCVIAQLFHTAHSIVSHSPGPGCCGGLGLLSETSASLWPLDVVTCVLLQQGPLVSDSDRD